MAPASERRSDRTPLERTPADALRLRCAPRDSLRDRQGSALAGFADSSMHKTPARPPSRQSHSRSRDTAALYLRKVLPLLLLRWLRVYLRLCQLATTISGPAKDFAGILVEAGHR